MIFVTVGTQLAFDRMVGAVDAWAARSGAEVFAQVGPSQQRFAHIRQSAFLEPTEFDRYFNEASLVVAHAGMGSILSALSFGKPIIIMPRKATLGEHRNEHQMATAKRFETHRNIAVAWNETELASRLLTMGGENPRSLDAISSYAPDAFIAGLKELINQ